jgi:DNA-binding XRE family transcriptional regulator
MKRGSKYHALFERLSTSGQEEITLTFAEIEALIGEELPPSARTRRDWWGNREGALQASAWMRAGYHVASVSLERGCVTFSRPVKKYTVQREGGVVAWDGDLVKALRLHMGLNQAQLAEELGVRQQTVSEWETGIYIPSRATCKYLSLVAERAGFRYGEED